MQLAATDSTANNKPGADKKPVADQPAAKTAASDAAALAKKLHDDSHPVTKPADKPAAAAAAPAAKPPEAKPAAPEAPKSQSWMGWLSDKEKSASAAISNEANQLKATVKADLKTVNAAASSVLATGEAVVAKTVAKGESTLAQFGTVSITGLTDTAGKIEQGVKHALAGDTNGSKTNEVAGAAHKQVQPDSKAVPAAAADTPGLLDTVESMAKTAANYVKTGVEDVIGKDTTNALLNVAAEYAGPLLFGAAGALVVGEVLPAMVATAGTAVKYYNNFIGDSTFEKGAVKVDSFSDAKFDSSSAKQKSDESFLAKAASYFIMGDATPGGGASITRNGDQVSAAGTTKDGISYKTTTTPGESSALVGAMKILENPNGTSASNGDMTITRTPPITTIKTKDNQIVTFNSVTKDLQMSDPATGFFFEKNLDGLVTTIGTTELDQANRGKIQAELDKALKTGIQMRLITDADGDKGFVLANGTKYLLNKVQKTATLEQGDFKLVVYGPNHSVQLFHKDATGKFVSVKPNSTTLPKGWEIDGNTVKLNGSVITNVDSIIKLQGAVMNATGFTADTSKGPVTLTSDGKNTKVTGPGGTTIEATPEGSAKITEPGKETINIEPTGVTVADSKSVAKIATDGSSSLLDVKTGQEADIDAKGNETSYNAQHQKIFAMNNQGDMSLADGTTISHTGAVVNTARNINEPSFNGKTADEVVREASMQAASLGSSLSGGSGMEASLASLESALAMLDSLGDVPGLAEQIGAAKGSIETKIAEVKNKEYLNSLLSQSGKDSSTIEQAFKMRGAGLSDQDIANRVMEPQKFAAQDNTAA